MSKKLLIFFTASALTATTALRADDEDPPRRAARLGLVEGTVSLQPASVDDWISAELNRPLTTGDRLWSADDGQAELSIGSAIMRLSHRTDAAFVNLDDHITQVELFSGIMILTVRDLTNGEAVEVDTPQLAFTVLRPGKYRFDVDEHGESTLVTVVNGEGEAMAAGQAYSVLPGEGAKVAGDAAVYSKVAAPPPDPFDDWCARRDKRAESSRSAQYIAPDVPGIEDLDENGIWHANPQYGEMWMPTGVPDDWAPYRAGHWDWIEPWGWTWVDDTAWGFAPFHYGRWVFVGGAWGWIPGPLGGPAFFAPALVAWIGGDGFVVGGELAIGWVPLAPGELFIPGYRASARYFEVVNARNTVASRTQIRNAYANTYLNHGGSRTSYINEHARGGTTVVSHGAMTGGKPVMKSMVSPSKATLAFKNYQQNAPVAPRRDSVSGGRPSTSARPPAGLANRTIMTKAAPPPDRPSFQQKEAALRAHPGQPVDRATMANMHPASESHTYQSATVKPAPRPASTPAGTTLAGKSEPQAPPKRSGYGSITKSPGRPAGATGPVAGPGSRTLSTGSAPAGNPATPVAKQAPAAERHSLAPEPQRRPAPEPEHRASAPAPEHRATAPAPEHHASAPAPEHHASAPAPEHHATAPAPAPRQSAPAAPPRQAAPPAAPRPYVPPHH